MKAIFHKCYDDYGNLKDNALNIAFNLGKKEGLRKGKKIARAEFIEEFKDLGKFYSEIRAEVRTEVIEEVIGLAQHYLIGGMDLENATKYGNKNAKQQDISYGTLMRYEIADCVDDFIDSVEKLKEQK